MFKQLLLIITALLSMSFLASLIFILFHYSSEAEREAEFGVVFGAKVWIGGVPSHSISDRTETAIKLLKSGKVKKLILSGGFSETGYWESEVMLKMALEQGVDRELLILDNGGVNSIATLKNLDKNRSYTLISNDFHLGRLKLLSKKVELSDIQLHRAEYHYGRYGKEFYFLFRETVALLYYLVN